MALKVDQAIARILASLPDDVTSRLGKINFEHRPFPTAVDVERGATPDHHGYFWGQPIEHVSTTELPDEADPEGVIVVFTGKLKPLTPGALARVLLHEIAHVIGYDEQTIVEEMGLGSPPEAA